MDNIQIHVNERYESFQEWLVLGIVLVLAALILFLA